MTTITQARLSTIFLAGRRSSESTEVFIQIAEEDLPVLYLEVWGRLALIGYAKLQRCDGAVEVRQGRSASTFELVELLSADSPVPNPVVALSGVLWNRRELAGELEEACSSPAQAGLPGLTEPRPTGGSRPHET